MDGSTRATRTAVSCVVAGSVLANLPHYLAFASDWEGQGNGTGFQFNRTSFGQSTFYVEIYYKWLQAIFNFFIPFTALAICNLFTVRALQHSTHSDIQASKSKAPREAESRLTVMIICMTAIFFLCELMAALGHVMVSGYARYKDLPNDVNRCEMAANFLMIVNAASNFAIDCVTGRKFRLVFRSMMAARCRCCLGGGCAVGGRHKGGHSPRPSEKGNGKGKRPLVCERPVSSGSGSRGLADSHDVTLASSGTAGSHMSWPSKDGYGLGLLSCSDSTTC